MVKAVVNVHPLASFAVMVYEPANRPVKFPLGKKIVPFLEYSMVPTPPDAWVDMVPLACPKHAILVCVAVVQLNTVGSVKPALALAVQPLVSVTVMV